MRQVFTSPRLENVEAVAKILADAGIETRLTDAQSWNRATKRDYSYSDRSGSSGYKWPAVWVVKTGEYGDARRVLKEAGVLLPTTRGVDLGSYTPAAKAAPAPTMSGATKFRLALFAVLLVVAAVQGLRHLGVLSF
ncbi:MAG: DUF2007 domain-containing protein [Xanthomonadaceae bacterium]|jgi:hypothetical protein|nr:DUF2007 domain-containing protein [Xanthomonadaceae bacterium]